MATSSRALVRLAAPHLRGAGRQFLSTSSRQSLTAPTRTTVHNVHNRVRPVARQLQRHYADAPASGAAPKKPRRFRTLRWIWRLTYLSVLGGIGYVGYGVYLDRHPGPQSQPDPSKKTLVILGTYQELSGRPVGGAGELTTDGLPQEPGGAPSLSSRSSTRRTTMSWSSPPATTFSSRRCSRRAQRA